MTGVASLEQSCRRLLRWFPRSWRAEREDELLEVLIQITPPGRHRPPFSETVALLSLGFRVWCGRVLAPDRRDAFDAMSLLAVVLPMVLVFPAASALALGTSWPWASSLFTAGVPGWLLWVLTAVLTASGSAVWAKRIAVAATVAFLAGEVAQVLDHNFRTVAMDGIWIAAQLLAVTALWNPQRVIHGRQLLRPRLLVAAGLVSAAFGFFYGLRGRWLMVVEGAPGTYAAFAAAVMFGAAVFGVVLLASRLGRALLPVLGALVALGWASRRVAGGLLNFPADIPDWFEFTLSDLLPVLVVPSAVFVGLRLLTMLATHMRGRRGRAIMFE